MKLPFVNRLCCCKCFACQRSKAGIETESPLMNQYENESENTRLRSLSGSKECIKEGYLQMHQRSFQRCKMRYFKLYPQHIYYAKEPTSNLFHEIHTSVISIAETSVNNVNNCFKVITGDMTLSLSSDSRRNMEDWISAFKTATYLQNNIKSELTDTLSGDHHWYSCTHSRPTFCNVCRDPLPGVTAKGLSCEVCRFKAHKNCAAKAPRNCKWTTLECLPPEERSASSVNGEYPMPHQWLEGNVSSNLRCVVCNKNCGSKRRLQDWYCLWCENTVHNSCKSEYQRHCSLGLNRLSLIPPNGIKRAEQKGAGVWETAHPNHHSPLIVFVNSKSGDNQGIRFMRRFKQLLNPAQVFDLSVAGPTLGVSMCKSFQQFRILVCGGDGSVGWVMTELDKQQLINRCQIGVLPLGTGNDLARVFGWGSACYDIGVIPLVLQQLERARPLMLDRWAIMTKEFPSSRPEGDNIFRYEDSIVMHITRMLASNQYDVVIQSARFLCETIKDFVELVGVATSDDEDSLSAKCTTLQHKLTLLLRTLQIESEASTIMKRLDSRCSSTMDDLDKTDKLKKKNQPVKWHSESEISDSEHYRQSSKLNKNTKQKNFIPKDHLWSRANSLKKALREIIDHTEKAVDEQNQRTAQAITQSLMTSSSKTSFLDDLPETIIDADEKDIFTDKEKEVEEIKEVPTNLQQGGKITLSQEELDIVKAISEIVEPERSTMVVPNASPSPFDNLKSDVFFGKSKNTVVYPGTVIARAFQKPVDTGIISKVLLANANALCATALSGCNDHELLSNFEEKCVMNNYFGVGIDAKISLDFHNKREEHPEKCRSRTRNFIWYGVLGGKELINRTYRNLEQNVHLEVDGHKINLPSLQGIVVLNIPSYMGGSNFWGTKKEVDGFVAPSFDDKMLEVVAVLGASQMGMSKVFGGMQHHRISQCHTVKITITDEAVPVQVDGEAWMQNPGIIQIVHKNRAPMLMRDREFEETLRSWNELKQSKIDRISEPFSDRDMVAIQPVVESVTSLVRSVKAASMMNSVVQQELYQMATTLATLSECFHKKVSSSPSATLSPNVSHGEVVEFLSCAKAFIKEVNEKMWTLKPKLSTEMESRINDSLSKADQDIKLYSDRQDYDEELVSTSRTGSTKTSKSWHVFGRKAVSCREKSVEDTIDNLERKPISEWSVSDVEAWLETIGCSEYRAAFRQHDIRGPELMVLQKSDLQDLGIRKVGHITRILEKIRRQQRQQSSLKSMWTRKTVS